MTGPDGQTLRRFVDSDRDGSVDQFSYFKNGLEVYRDQANKNLKIESSRWFNLGGTRWGLYSKLDGKIDFYLDAIVAGGPHAVNAAKRLVREVAGRPAGDVREKTVERIAGIRVSDEGQEGMRAFLERRKPKW